MVVAITTALFVASLLPIVVYLVGIYLANNPIARLVIFSRKNSLISIDASFFLKVLSSQCWLALVLAAWVAPRLVSFDLADNALPILLSHPISRFGYVSENSSRSSPPSPSSPGFPPSAFCLSGLLVSRAWIGSHLRIGWGFLPVRFSGSSFSLYLGLALSSWVKWRVVATGVIFAAVFVPAGIGGIASAVLRTKWGLLINVPVMMTQLWQRMLGAPKSCRET